MAHVDEGDAAAGQGGSVDMALDEPVAASGPADVERVEGGARAGTASATLPPPVVPAEHVPEQVAVVPGVLVDSEATGATAPAGGAITAPKSPNPPPGSRRRLDLLGGSSPHPYANSEAGSGDEDEMKTN